MINFILELKSIINNNKPGCGSLIVAKDTKELFADADGERIQINDIIQLNTEDELYDILAPLSNKFYFVKETNCLFNYNNNKWTPITGGVTTSDIDSIIDSLE